MSGLRKVARVAGREVRERGRSRTYRISTAILLLVAVSLIVVPQLFGGEDTREYRLGIVGELPPGLLIALEALADAAEVRILTERYDAADPAEAALEAGEVDALLVDGAKLVLAEEPGSGVFGDAEDGQLSSLVGGAVLAVRLEAIVAASGLSAAEVIELLTEEPLEIVGLEPADPDRAVNAAASFFGLFVLYIAILSYGAWTLNGVIEEKTSQVVEVLLSTLRPHQLMAGKVLGIGVLGLVQLVIVVVAAAAAALAVDLVEVPQVAAGTVGSLLLWFVLGFAFYSVAYAAVGALVSRMEEAQSVATPLTLVGVGAYLVAFIALENPDGAVAQVTTFLPPVAPFVVPIRVANDAISIWETAASVVVMLVITYGLVRLAGRVYSGAILSVGRRMRLRDAWRSAEL